jgi:hypothetical protein
VHGKNQRNETTRKPRPRRISPVGREAIRLLGRRRGLARRKETAEAVSPFPQRNCPQLKLGVNESSEYDFSLTPGFSQVYITASIPETVSTVSPVLSSAM